MKELAVAGQTREGQPKGRLKWELMYRPLIPGTAID